MTDINTMTSEMGLKKRIKILMLIIYNENMRKSHEEIGISYITAFLRQHGFQVKLLGLDDQEINYSEIAEYKPDIIGLTTYDINLENVVAFSKTIKKLLPQTWVCVGGILPTYYANELLSKYPSIDIAVKGEGELPFLELAEKIENNLSWKDIAGLVYRSGDKIIDNGRHSLIEDLNDLPYPARDLIEKSGAKIAQISSTRGCSGRCTFCASQLFWKSWRSMKTSRVVDEMIELKNKYGINKFNIIDGSFDDTDGETVRYEQLADLILEKNLFIFYYAHIQADFHKKATPSIMKKLKNSGLCSVCIGIEAGNAKDLKLYGKRSSLEDIEKTIRIFREYEIAIEPGFINFNPYSTIETLKENINFLEKLGLAKNLEHILMHYSMLKGTALYKKIVRDGLFEDDFNDYRYRFQDDRIRILHTYLKEYLQYSTSDGMKPLDVLIYFTNKIFAILCFYKRTFSKPEHHEALLATQDYENSIRELGSHLNSIISDWFRNLLLLCETGWSHEEAEKISNSRFSRKYMEFAAKSFLSYRAVFYRKLIRMNSIYQDYILAYD